VAITAAFAGLSPCVVAWRASSGSELRLADLRSDDARLAQNNPWWLTKGGGPLPSTRALVQGGVRVRSLHAGSPRGSPSSAWHAFNTEVSPFTSGKGEAL
jgi:hypothetical protein